jgi:hypothetical protein
LTAQFFYSLSLSLSIYISLSGRNQQQVPFLCLKGQCHEFLKVHHPVSTMPRWQLRKLFKHMYNVVFYIFFH